jgi:hypothetical protein
MARKGITLPGWELITSPKTPNSGKNGWMRFPEQTGSRPNIPEFAHWWDSTFLFSFYIASLQILYIIFPANTYSWRKLKLKLQFPLKYLIHFWVYRVFLISTKAFSHLQNSLFSISMRTTTSPKEPIPTLTGEKVRSKFGGSRRTPSLTFSQVIIGLKS